VLFGEIFDYLFAYIPTKTVLFYKNHTTDGVVRDKSTLGII